MSEESRQSLTEKIAEIVGENNVKNSQSDLLCYSYDASLSAALPSLVIHFSHTSQISPTIKLLNEYKIPFTPRSAGTNLCGAAVNLKGGAVLNLAGLKKIRQIDTQNKIALVEPGVVNSQLQEELKKYGFFYAPDPASQKVCTIGGNIAQNAGGPQCLKYGVTCDHVEKLEVVLPDGTERIFSRKDPGPDMVSLFCQSEGTLGIIKHAWLKILPIPSKIKTITCFFEDIENSMKAVSAVISCGIVPRTLEEVDALSIEAAGSSLTTAGAKAMLIAELEGDSEEEAQKIEDIFKKFNGFSIQKTDDPEKREELWKIRKESYPALARIGENVMVEDGVVPRPNLPEAVKRIKKILEENRLRAGLVFHAGDGNIHPNIVFDQRDLEETRRAKKAGEEILKVCIELGGDISGEHGIGVEKRKAMNWRYDVETLDFFSKIKKAMDENNLANPDKKIPVSLGQIEVLKKDFIDLSKEAQEIKNEIKLRKEKGIKTIITSKNKMGDKNGARYLSCARLCGIFDLDKENLTVTVESGITLKKLKQNLIKEGMDISIPEDDISLGAAAALKKYDNLRYLTLGADFILSNGSLIRLGGKTIKSVSGYNAFPLLLGSKGVFAFIISLTLRIKNPAFAKEEIIKCSQCASSDFSKDPILVKIKKTLDPQNLFNPSFFPNI
ncbi:MAG: FAD-linked oxidase C-terminal domain-containing protein [Elusimicrobiota bacterium]